MEAGVALALVSLVVQFADLYEKIKSHSIEFRRLDEDLKCFYDALVLAEHYLDHQRLSGTREACEQIASDINSLLLKRQRQNSVERVIFKVSSSEIREFRRRMHLHMTFIHHSASELRGRGLGPGNAMSTSPQARLDANVRDLDELESSQAQHHTTQYPSRAQTRPTVLRSSISPFSSSTDTSLDELPSLRSADSQRSAASTRSYVTDCTSLVSSRSGSSSPLGTPRQRSIGNIATGLEAAEDFKIKTICNFLITLAQTSSIHNGDIDQAKALLDHGALLEYTDAACSRTPLIWAIVAGRKDLLELFLYRRASVDTPDGIWDWTPVMWAVMEQQDDILDILIRRRADLNKTDSKRKRTALIWAASSGRDDAVGSLIASRPSLIDVSDGEEMTPLACAYFAGHWNTARLLFEAGANANAKVHGTWLLEWAISASNKEFVNLFLEHHALPNNTNAEGVPLFILAVKGNLPDIVEVMINKGADVQCTDRSRFSALMWAVWHSNQRIVEILVTAGADLAAVDCKGTTAHALAKQSCNRAILQLTSPPG